MNSSPLPPSSYSPPPPSSVPHTLSSLPWSSPPHSATAAPSNLLKAQSSSTSYSLRVQATAQRVISPELTLGFTTSAAQQDHKLLNLLRQRKTQEAWALYSHTPHLPSPTCLSRLVSQLSYFNTPDALSRAQSILTRLRNEGQLHRLDSNSLGLLASAAARQGQALYASSVIRSMLRSGYLPHVKAWSAVVARLTSSSGEGAGPVAALALFDSVTRRVSHLLPDKAADSRPDTAAYNAALNACAILGDTQRFLRLFEEMPKFGAEPDVMS